MNDIKVEDLVKLAKEFTESTYGKFLMESANDTRERVLREGMNSESSDSQLKALNYAAGLQYLTDIVEQHVYYADHPEVLESTLKRNP